jgi:hypothetical protein
LEPIVIPHLTVAVAPLVAALAAAMLAAGAARAGIPGRLVAPAPKLIP